MREVRLNERQLVSLIRKVVNENSDKDFVTGISASKRAELIVLAQPSKTFLIVVLLSS